MTDTNDTVETREEADADLKRRRYGKINLRSTGSSYRVRSMSLKERQEWLDCAKQTEAIPLVLSNTVVNKAGEKIYPTAAEAGPLVEADARAALELFSGTLAFSGQNRPIADWLRSELTKLDNGEVTVDQMIATFRESAA